MVTEESPVWLDMDNPANWPSCEELTDEMVKWIEGEAESNFDSDNENRSTDWDEVTGDLESYFKVNLPSTYEHPVMKQLQRIYRKVRKELRDG